MSLLQIETITEFSSLETLRHEWANLELALKVRLPFTSPLWTLNWWRHFQRATIAARDELHSYAVRDDAGNLVAVAPMFITHRPGFGPFRLRELQFFGADPYVTEWRGVLCHPDHRSAALATIIATINEQKPADVIQWRGLPASLGDVPPVGFSENDQMGTKVFFLNLPESWEQFRSDLPRNVKESIRKCYNSLARDKHEFDLRVVCDLESVDEALDKFFQLHSMRAGATATVEHPNVFDAPNAREFLRSVCRDLASDGRLRIFQLIIAEQVVATRIGILMGDQIFMYFSGYDLDWARYSVMTTTVAEAIKWSIANKLTVFNLSTGEDVSKTRWRPECEEFKGGYSLYGAGLGRVAALAIHSLRARRSSGPVKLASVRA